ncbi:MAG: BlaI/MecI/CopY family transcriptional regulator [Acidimicrobiia bacterium]|nr:BlaI/MecI/CopY family transcriptional regulator [Acidimicrobiia bacterium]
MTNRKLIHLSRRERQILDVLYRQERASAADVQANLPDPPSYSAVRAMLRILETKGLVRHEQDGARYVFLPIVKRDTAKRGALRHLVDTFFQGSATQVMAALVEMSGRELGDDELARLRRLIDDAGKDRSRS